MTSTTGSGSSSASSLIKTDALGRMRTSPERREMLLNEFDRSGMSGAEFAAMIGIKYQTFAGWRQRRPRRRKAKRVARVPAKPPARLVEAGVVLNLRPEDRWSIANQEVATARFLRTHE